MALIMALLVLLFIADLAPFGFNGLYFLEYIECGTYFLSESILWISS